MKHHLRIPSIPRQEATVSILEKDILLLGSKGTARRRALFDSGASYSIIRRELAESLEHVTAIPDPENYIFETARPDDTIQAMQRVSLEFRFDDSEARFSDEFIVFDECSEEVIIGATTMQKWSIKLDFDREEIHYRKHAVRLRV
ncbi:MAG: retropepsin-like aspartic protease [Spirochaetia bacterium]